MKKLSDGTSAKIGMIVVVIDDPLNGNEIGTITKIIDLAPEDDSSIKCIDTFGLSGNKNETFWEELSCLRSATDKEKREYNKIRKSI